MTVSIKHDNIEGPSEAQARLDRAVFVTGLTKDLGYGFVAIAVGLFISVAVLVRNLAKGNKKVSDLPNVFKSEAKHLSVILSIFAFTYMVRFISDRWVFPLFLKLSKI